MIACMGGQAFAQDEYRFHALPLKDNPQLTEEVCNNMLTTLDSMFRNGQLLAFYSIDWPRITSVYNGMADIDTLRPARDKWFLTNRYVDETGLINSRGGDSVQVLEGGSEVYIFMIETCERIQTFQLKEIRIREKAVWNEKKKRYDYLPYAFCPVWCHLEYDRETMSPMPENTLGWIPFRQLENLKTDWLILLKGQEWKGVQYRQEAFAANVAQPTR